MLLAAVFAVAMQAVQSPPEHVEKPCIYIKWSPGTGVFPRAVGEFEIAAWKSGRVIWRVSPLDPWPKSLDLSAGTYKEGKVPAATVVGVLQLLKERRLFEKRTWGRSYADTDLLETYLSFEEQATKIVCVEGKVAARSDIEDLRAWHHYWLTNQSARGVIPDIGYEIVRPPFEEQVTWLP
jgi:hypothetical protein